MREGEKGRVSSKTTQRGREGRTHIEGEGRERDIEGGREDGEGRGIKGGLQTEERGIWREGDQEGAAFLGRDVQAAPVDGKW